MNNPLSVKTIHQKNHFHQKTTFIKKPMFEFVCKVRRRGVQVFRGSGVQGFWGLRVLEVQGFSLRLGCQEYKIFERRKWFLDVSGF